MKKILVTEPLIPCEDKLFARLRKINQSKWLTNNGPQHVELESKLVEFLGVSKLCLQANGTLALINVLKSLDLKGEVITTPYTFIATAQAIELAGLKPVFVDIDEKTKNIDPSKIEEKINENTCAILGVHVYGEPCDVKAINEISEKYSLKVVYDAAHAFNVKIDGASVLSYGDASILSFHATKTFSTIEGGAIICNSDELYDRVEKFKNFGIDSLDGDVINTGFNSKLNEYQSAYGIENLNIVNSAIERRKEITEYYDEKLGKIKGISISYRCERVHYNYSYYPIYVDESESGWTRDELFELLQDNGVIARKYFILFYLS